jgi:plasmid stabilization system protein ParE
LARIGDHQAPSPREVRQIASVVWTDRALSDLEAIGDFIAADNPRAAERWVGALMVTAERAAGAPMAGRRVPELGRHDVREVITHLPDRVPGDERCIEVLTVFGSSALSARRWSRGFVNGRQ